MGTKEKPTLRTPETDIDKDLARQALLFTKKFDEFLVTYTYPQQKLPTETELGLMVVHETPFPLIVIGAAADFAKGIITLHPSSDTHNIIVSTNYQTDRNFSGSVVARFGENLNKFESFSGETSPQYFRAPQYNKKDGKGGSGQGFIATFNTGTGNLDKNNYFWVPTSKIAPTFAVIFAGFNARFKQNMSVYHGLTVISGKK